MPKANISLDLDNLWSYLKVHGDEEWKSFPSYLQTFVPLITGFLEQQGLKITFFIVGKDLEDPNNLPWIRRLSDAGHDFGNHSYMHEPWMEERQESEVIEELKKTDALIQEATGKKPIGFRGPGFSISQEMLNAVKALGYKFDTSLFPMSLTMVARIVYRFSMKKVSEEDKGKRKNLFGKTSNLFYPLKPFRWDLQQGDLLELPVTTMPFFRFPIHLSYIIWLSGFSKPLALTYLKFSLFLLKITNTPLTLLLHPLDFLGKEDVKELSFFPGMNLSRSHKLEVAREAVTMIKKGFTTVSMSEFASEAKTEPLKIKQPPF